MLDDVRSRSRVDSTGTCAAGTNEQSEAVGGTEQNRYDLKSQMAQSSRCASRTGDRPLEAVRAGAKLRKRATQNWDLESSFAGWIRIALSAGGVAVTTQ